MDKRIIDTFKESQREIDLNKDKAIIDGVEYNITYKSFENGVITTKVSAVLFVEGGKNEMTITFELKDFVKPFTHFRIAMSTINKSDRFIVRLKNRIKIIKYFLFN